MHNLPRKIDATIRSFYIFNTTYGHKEGQEKEKIFYYFPKEIDINAKIRDVGLSQAFTAFTDSFTDKPGECEVIHTEKTTQLLYRTESNFWIVLVLNVPKEIHSKDGVEYPEYHKHELHDAFYRRLLIQSYNRFCLENGTFQVVMKTLGNASLKKQLEKFFDNYINSLKLPANDIIEFMNSLQYLPLDKLLFLRVHTYIDSLKVKFPLMTDAIFLYKEFVVVGGKINTTDLFTLHQYIFQNIEEFNRECMQLVYLQSNGIQTYYKMIFFSSDDAILCLFFDYNFEVQLEVVEKLGQATNLQMDELSRDIEDFLNKQSSSLKTSSVAASTDCVNNTECMSPKYLFLNDQSLKMTSNVYDDTQRITQLPRKYTTNIAELCPRIDDAVERHYTQRRTPLPQNITNLIADLFNSTDNEVENPQRDVDKTSYEEIMVKSTDDFWIVKRRFNWRQRFVIIFSQKATLLDVTKEAERIFEQEIKDGVFADR